MSAEAYIAAVKTALLATGKPAALGTSVYEEQLPADKQLPAVRIAVLVDMPSQRLADASNTRCDVQVDVYANRADYATAWDIDQWCRSKLDRQTLAATGFGRVDCLCMERGRPLKEDGYFRITSRYRLFGSAA